MGLWRRVLASVALRDPNPATLTMAQINPPKPLVTPEQRAEERQDRFQTTVARSRSFYEENAKLLIGAGIAIVVLIVAIIGFVAWRASQDAEAEQALGSILSVYEAGDYETALSGTDDAPGLMEIADDYGSATAAPFFAGDALFQLGRYDEAARYFEMVDDNGLMGASALAGRAAVHEAQGENEDAAELYERAASLFKSEATSPGYFLDAGRAYQAAGDMDAARGAYQHVLDDYAETPEATTATVEIASVEAAANAVGTPTGDVVPAPAQDSTAATAVAIPERGGPGGDAASAPAGHQRRPAVAPLASGARQRLPRSRLRASPEPCGLVLASGVPPRPARGARATFGPLRSPR